MEGAEEEVETAAAASRRGCAGEPARAVAALDALPRLLLRMHYHDCFVQGCDCDGSMMLKSRKKAGRDVLPNRSMCGYDAAERIMAGLETLCPLTVSCDDIIAIAVRDAIYLDGDLRYCQKCCHYKPPRAHRC